MKRKVIRKQENSKNCLVCGLQNPFSLKASFYEMETKELVAIFTPCMNHQGYPGRLHGGVSMAILDETIGRAVMLTQSSMVWGVTIEFTGRFRKPVPLDVPLRVVTRITNDNGRIFEGTGEILLPNGEVGVEGKGKYLKMPIEKIADFDRQEQTWFVVTSESDPAEIDL